MSVSFQRELFFCDLPIERAPPAPEVSPCPNSSSWLFITQLK